MALSPLAQRYDQFILDLDGCVWVGGEATPGAVEAIAALREGGKRLAFATNDARSAGEDYVTQALGPRHPGLPGGRRDRRAARCSTCSRRPAPAAPRS